MTADYPRWMLPILGIQWHQFPTEREAKRFAKWAEQTTRRSEHPCETFIEFRNDLPTGEQWEVKVRNW